MGDGVLLLLQWLLGRGHWCRHHSCFHHWSTSHLSALALLFIHLWSSLPVILALASFVCPHSCFISPLANAVAAAPAAACAHALPLTGPPVHVCLSCTCPLFCLGFTTSTYKGTISIFIKIGCKQMQPNHVKWVTATSNTILPCNIVFVKISELGIYLQM